MTKKEKNEILNALVGYRNDYEKECEKRIASEQGKIMGADYILQKFFDVLRDFRTEVESQESDEAKSCYTCESCKYKNKGEREEPCKTCFRNYVNHWRPDENE